MSTSNATINVFKPGKIIDFILKNVQRVQDHSLPNLSQGQTINWNGTANLGEVWRSLSDESEGYCLFLLPVFLG